MWHVFIIHLASVIGFIILWLLKYLLFIGLSITAGSIILFIISSLLDKEDIDIVSGKDTLEVIVRIICFVVGLLAIKLIYSLLGIQLF